MGVLHAPQEVWDVYYPALGRFMHAFGEAEDRTNSVLQRYVVEHLFGEEAQDPQGIIQALLGGMRLKPLKDTFLRVLRTTGAKVEVQDVFIRVLAHIAEIQHLRDRLAHNAGFPDYRDGEWWFGTTNLNTLREWDQHEMLFFKIEMLNDAAWDLNISTRELEYALYPKFFDESDALLKLEDPAYVCHHVPPSWRYIPSKLQREGSKTRITHQQPQRQRQASQKKPKHDLNTLTFPRSS